MSDISNHAGSNYAGASVFGVARSSPQHVRLEAYRLRHLDAITNESLHGERSCLEYATR